MLILKTLAALAFIGSIVWFIAQPDYEPAIAVVTSLSALIGLWGHDKTRRKHARQSQNVAAGGIGVQAGGDVRIGSVQSHGEIGNAEK